MGHFTETLNNEFKNDPTYYRSRYQSYMTAPEWRNVEISEDFASFIKEGHSMFHFPYFTQIYSMWRIFLLSYFLSRQHDSDHKIITSEYMVMDLFVALFTTFELLPKALLSLPLSLFVSQNNESEMQTLFAQYFAEYANDIQTQPFYKHDFKQHRLKLTEQYKACQQITWNDWFTWSYLSWEMWIKQYVSSAVNAAFEPGPNDVIYSATTDILVKLTIDGTDLIAANALFIDKLNTAIANFEAAVATEKQNTPEDDIHLVDELKSRVKINKNQTYVYARLTAPRYTDFHKAINALTEQGIYLRKIAGQDKVQVKCEVIASDAPSLRRAVDKINQTPDTTPLYTYQDGINANRKLCLFDVPIKNLHSHLHQLESHNTEKSTSCIKFIHNF